MYWKKRIENMVGEPVGISLHGGKSVAGVLCGIEGETVYIMEYLSHNQFTVNTYTFEMIRDANYFPSCTHGAIPVEPGRSVPGQGQ